MVAFIWPVLMELLLLLRGHLARQEQGALPAT